MAETTVATNVHQTLDVHGGFAAQITLDGEKSDLLTQFLEIGVAQIFDFLGIGDTAGFANFACAGATDSENRCQSDLRVLIRRDVDTCDTCHMLPLKRVQSALALLVTGVRTNHANDALAPDNFAIAANLLYRCGYFHTRLLRTTIEPVPQGIRMI
jgi:hypothetical protein